MFYRLIFLLGISLNALCQSNIPVGNWRAHLSYKSVQTVEVAGDRIYAGSPTSAFYIENGEFYELSKLTGLSDVEITKIRFHERTKTAVFGYGNGNIDLIVDQKTIINLNDIVRASIQGSKRVNEIHFHENLALLSTDFGVVVVDLIKREIKESYQNFTANTEVFKVNATVVYRDTIYACTQKGLYISKYSNTNLMDFSTWKKEIPLIELENVEALGAAVHNDKIYVGFRENGIVLKDNNGWKQSPAQESNGPVAYGMRTSNEKLMFCSPYVHYIFNDQLVFIEGSTYQGRDAVYDRAGNLYVADLSLGLLFLPKGEKKFISQGGNGPSSSQVFNLKEVNGSVFKMAGGYNNFFGEVYNNSPLDRFANGVWDIPFSNQEVNTLVDMEYNPVNEKFYYCSYLSGLFVQSQNDFKVYNSKNSPLIDVSIGGTGVVRTASIAVEKSGNVWVGNFALPKFPQLFKIDINDNFVKGYTLTDQLNSPMQIVIDDYQNLWIRGSAKSLMVFNEKRSTLFNSSFTNNTTMLKGLKNANVTTITKDRKGEIWVGTEAGVAVYSDPGLLDQPNRPDFSIPYFAGFPLLFDKLITSIKVDAANRKWIGTTSGIWLMNESGTEEIHHFNVDNSPLISNYIVDIEIEPTTGEVLIGTDKGIVSYRGTATEPNKEGKFENVSVFPNPIKPSYSGNVAISGLATNETNVKITDIFGNLIYETKSTGGTATWNLKDYNGRRAKPGMYLVFNITPDGVESMVSKMAIVD